MLSDVFLNKIKEQLLIEKSRLLNERVRPTDIDTDGDETDGIQGNILIELQNQLSTRNNEKLINISNALQKIEEKTYGLCLDCGEYIPEKRLITNLHFLTCVSCAEDRERENRKRL